RIDAERRVDAVVRLGDRERPAAGLDAGADRDDAGDAGRAGARHELGGGRVAAVEMRVGVDHAAAVGVSTRGKSGGAGSIPSASAAVPRRTRSSARSSEACPSDSRIRGALSGRNGATATATAVTPSARL